MSTSQFQMSGVIPVLPTPFHQDESLDIESLERLVRFNVGAGAEGVTILGLLGESNRLTEEERASVIRTAIKAAGSWPVIVGTSHTGTNATVELTQEAVELGAAAVMIAPPVQSVPNERTVFDYFHRIALRVSAPIVLQDYPAMNQVHMSAEFILRLVQEVPSVVAIKAEAVPSPQKIAALKEGLMGRRHVAILTGLGGLYGFFDLERGADGFNTGFAFPEVLHAMLYEFRRGEVDAARRIYTRYLPLLVFEQQPGVAIRKEILRRRKLLTSNCVRHPGNVIDAGTADQLTRLLGAIFASADITQVLAIRA